MSTCSHIQKVNFTKVLGVMANTLPLILQLQADKVSTDNKLVFLRIDVEVVAHPETDITPSPTDIVETEVSFELLFKRIGPKWTNVMCLMTLEVYCFHCEIECLDEDITKSFLKGHNQRALSGFKAEMLKLLQLNLRSASQSNRQTGILKKSCDLNFLDYDRTYK